MISLLLSNKPSSFALTIAVLISFLAVPSFSIFFWQELNSSYERSKSLGLRTDTSLSLLTKLEQVSQTELSYVQLLRNLLDSRTTMYLDTSLTQAINETAGILETQAEKTGDYSKYNKLYNELSEKIIDDFLQTYFVISLTAEDEFAELDSLASEAMLAIERQIQDILKNDNSFTNLELSSVQWLLERERNLWYLRTLRKADYLDQNIAESIRKKKILSPNTPQPLKKNLIEFDDFLRNRYLEKTITWINDKGRVEAKAVQLYAQIEDVHKDFKTEVQNQLSLVRKELDADIAELTGARLRVQSSLTRSGILTLVVSFLLGGLVVWVYIQVVNSNRNLSLKISESTKDLARANQELERNIVELQATQAQLIKSEKLASLATLVAGIAHEINTPLGVALTAATFEEQKLKEYLVQINNGNGSGRDIELIMQANIMIIRNLERTADLVRSFKQVSVDQTRDDIREFILDNYVRDVIFSLSSSFRNTNITISQGIQTGIHMKTYAGGLAQVLTNLVFNAKIHAFPQGTSGNIDISGKETAGWVEIIVKDNGIGISADMQEKVFEPFFTSKRDSGGTGLGLFIVQNLVNNQLGGSIEILEPEQTGTRFCIRLPAII